MDKEHRVRSRGDFIRVQRDGRRLAHPLLRLQWAANGLDVTRFGFVVGKRVARKAHERNLVRRRLRALARSRVAQLAPGMDIVVIAQRPAATASFAELATALQQLIRRAPLAGSQSGEGSAADATAP